MNIEFEMAIFRNLKRAFGFSDSELDEAELEGIDARVTPLRSRVEEHAASSSVSEKDTNVGDTPAGQQSQSPAGTEDSAVVPSAIFESVVKIFNEALPDFIKGALDEKAQCDFIYQSLEGSMKSYIENLEVDVRHRCNKQWENERKNLQMQMETLRRKAQKDEEDSSDSKKLQLSAERQKRALSERVHELEKQLASIEAENEQYVLENKSLVNKLRLSSVLGGDVPAGENADAVAAKIAEMTEALDASKAECTALKEEIASLNTALEQSKVKDDLGDAMLTDLNAKVAAAQEDAKAHEETAIAAADALKLVEKEKDALRQEVDALRQSAGAAMAGQDDLKGQLEMAIAENRSLKGELSELQITHGATAEELKEALENLSVVEDMHRQLASLEEARRGNEAFLRKQKDELMQKDEQLRQAELEKNEYMAALNKKDETINSLEDLADSLRKTIEDNLYEHAQTQSALRSEIERLKGGKVEEPQPAAGAGLASEPLEADSGNNVAPVKTRSKKSKLKISAIDETLEDTDWLIATPPPAKKKLAHDDEPGEFGYREPTRKSTPDNPAQMSLW